jgi:archaellum biogenesis ATPase FlaH
MVYLPWLAVPVAAVLTVSRAAWSYLGRRRQRQTTELDEVRLRATSWLRRAATHLVGQRLRRTWLVHYAVDRYASSLYKRHQTLTVYGRVELSIDRCYIPLELRAGHTTDASQLLLKSGTVLILGDPGTGKTALLSRLVRDLCRGCFENRDTSQLPVYASLQQIVSYLPRDEKADLRPDAAFSILDSWFQDFQLNALDLFDSSKMLLALAQSPKNGLVVLLDGLDEVSADDITAVESFIVALSQFVGAAPGKNVVIVASRRQALDFTPRLINGTIDNAVAVELQPFSPAAIYSFLLRWPYKPGYHATSEARRIFTQLRRNPTLLDTCSNPLALALYVNHYLRLRDLGQTYEVQRSDTSAAFSNDIPDTRAAFFTDIVDYLMIRRRAEQLGVGTPTRPVRQARTNFFVAVVDEHIKSNEPFNQISHDVMLRHIGGLARQNQPHEQALLELAKDTGIIVRDADGTWHFIQRSFLDYFLANSIAAISKGHDLLQLQRLLKVAPLRYLEGFYLACGLMASRNAPYLETVLRQLGQNTFVGRYYPRAMLEAQAYFFVPDFVERISFYCDLWRKRRRRDISLFRDLVSVIIDYEHSCEALGKPAEISAVEQFQDELRDEGTSVLQAARLDIELAMRIAKEESLAKILLGGSTEEAIVALYDPRLSDKLEQSEIESDARLAAIVAETALRSPLFASNLAMSSERKISRGFGRLPAGKERWADSWPIRGTPLAGVLQVAVPFIRTLSSDRRSEFPHLALLSSTRPIRRLRNELLFGDWRVSVLLVSVFVLVTFPFWLLGWNAVLLTLVAIPAALVILLLFRMALLKGFVTLRSQRILNLQPPNVDSATLLDKHVRLMTGAQSSFKRWYLQRPRSTDGLFTAVYVREAPFAWRRFCPALGDQKISRAGCAAAQHFWTEDVRRVVRS